MIKLAIVGAAGRMGNSLVRCAQKVDGLDVVVAIDQPGNPALGKDVGEMAGLAAINVKISDSLQDVADYDVLIDFTLHAAVPGNVKVAAAAGKAVVIGTTGLNKEETSQVHGAAKKIPVVWAPNMSLGMNLLFAEVKKAARMLGADYGVEIDETHHVHKKDAPSGTALRLGEKVAEGSGRDFQDVYMHDPDGERGESQKDKIVIRSFREGEVVGVHTVSFENDGEKIEFTHRARSRDAFAMGALRAAQWVAGKEPGLYSMQDVLGL